MTPSGLSSFLRRMASKIDASSSPSRGAVAHSLKWALVAAGEWDHLTDPPTTKNGAATSDLLWHAMKELGVRDWSPSADLNAALKKMREIAAKHGIKDTKAAEAYAKDNFEHFHELVKAGKIDENGDEIKGAPGAE
jgi:hypothetical protein